MVQRERRQELWLVSWLARERTQALLAAWEEWKRNYRWSKFNQDTDGYDDNSRFFLSQLQQSQEELEHHLLHREANRSMAEVSLISPHSLLRLSPTAPSSPPCSLHSLTADPALRLASRLSHLDIQRLMADEILM
eukprot:TRINITY_DN2964_c0_g2_i1.p1 TRINITY_DN2964_c0_g2~~TRINITY_DN2964_c0_g2_i1.p1  ORF type:complete len:135 (+),score=4.21 TRINITY_DN2964_c0_g2_i1:49-453(+)